jgi:hypothetical protein
MPGNTLFPLGFLTSAALNSNISPRNDEGGQFKLGHDPFRRLVARCPPA